MRGMKGITEMMMEMVLVLMVLMKSSMETPEGDGGAFRRWLRQRFPPPIFSGGSLLSSISGFAFLRRLPLKLPEGPFISPVLGQDEATETKTDGIGATRRK